MTLYARLDADGVAIEVCDAAALATHEPVLRATFTPCPDGTLPSSTCAAGVWTPPAPVPPPVFVPPTVSTNTFFELFTVDEETTIRAYAAGPNPGAPALATWLRRLDVLNAPDVVLSLTSVQNGIRTALTVTGLSGSGLDARVAEILTGVLR